MQLTVYCAQGRINPRRREIIKLLRVMRLTTIILLGACLTAGATGFSQKVSLSVKKAPLDKVFRELKKQTGYEFLYNNEMLRNTETVTVELRNVSLQEALAACFSYQPLTYTIIERTIVVKPKTTAEFQSADNSLVAPPPIDIRGRIVNEKGEPVAASIVVKGTNKGTSTNANGEFQFKDVDENATLVISGVNIETIEVKVNGRTEINVTARMKVTIQEAITINAGYYRTTDRDKTGSISKISSAVIEQQPVIDPIQALQGRVPGLTVSQVNGNIPGGSLNVNIRGINSIAAGTSPLFIVDGVPFPSDPINPVKGTGLVYQTATSPFNLINPQDIESIEILKDADATAIYGSRGANGVVLLTTKLGKPGRTRVDANIYRGFGTMNQRINMLTLGQYLEMRKEAFANDNITPNSQNAPDLTVWDQNKSTNFQEYLIGGTSAILDASASLSGGNDLTKYLLSANYRSEGSVHPNKDLGLDKATFRLSISQALANKKVNITSIMTYGVDNNRFLPYLAPNFFYLPPNFPMYNSDGSVNRDPIPANTSLQNPASWIRLTSKNKDNHFTGSFNINGHVMKKLSCKCESGLHSINFEKD